MNNNQINKIRSNLLILINSETKFLNEKCKTLINSVSSKDIYLVSMSIEIQLQNEFFKSESNKKIFKVISPTEKILNRNSKRANSTMFESTTSLYQYNDKKVSSNDIDKISRKISIIEESKNNSKNNEIEENTLLEVYSNLLGCVESKKSIGYEKLHKDNFRQNSLKRIHNENDKSKEPETYDKINIINESKVDRVIDFLNRDKNAIDQFNRKKRLKEGIFYLHSLVYCFKITKRNLQKGKNKEEFNDFRKELLSPLINKKKSTVSFEVLKKVFIWKEDKQERSVRKKLSLVGFDQVKRKSARNKTTIGLENFNLNRPVSHSLKGTKEELNLLRNFAKNHEARNSLEEGKSIKSNRSKYLQGDLFEVKEEARTRSKEKQEVTLKGKDQVNSPIQGDDRVQIKSTIFKSISQKVLKKEDFLKESNDKSIDSSESVITVSEEFKSDISEVTPENESRNNSIHNISKEVSFDGKTEFKSHQNYLRKDD